jgi:ABC-type phosphate transport system substrate-binding protein
VNPRLLCLALLAVTAGAAPGVAEDAFNVIVNSANPGTQIRRETLQAIYLRKGARWPDGKPVEAVDQSTRSAVRAAFSGAVLGQDVQAVQNHWMVSISGGKGLPPPVKGSDQDVIAFVSSKPGAIGYVSAAAALGDSVKLLKLVP